MQHSYALTAVLVVLLALATREPVAAYQLSRKSGLTQQQVVAILAMLNSTANKRCVPVRPFRRAGCALTRAVTQLGGRDARRSVDRVHLPRALTVRVPFLVPFRLSVPFRRPVPRTSPRPRRNRHREPAVGAMATHRGRVRRRSRFGRSGRHSRQLDDGTRCDSWGQESVGSGRRSRGAGVGVGVPDAEGERRRHLAPRRQRPALERLCLWVQTSDLFSG